MWALSNPPQVISPTQIWGLRVKHVFPTVGWSGTGSEMNTTCRLHLQVEAFSLPRSQWRNPLFSFSSIRNLVFHGLRKKNILAKVRASFPRGPANRARPLRIRHNSVDTREGGIPGSGQPTQRHRRKSMGGSRETRLAEQCWAEGSWALGTWEEGFRGREGLQRKWGLDP